MRFHRGPRHDGPVVDALAAEIDAAHRDGRLLDAAGRALDLPTAYAVQRALTARRTARGARRIGWKLGYTSAAMRAQMGVDAPNLGPLLDTMLVPDGGRVPAALVQPRVEPEIALRIGPGGAPDAAFAALEVVDSVWRDYRFTLETNTADGSSAAGVVLGPPLPLDGLDAVPVALVREGVPAGTATGAAAMGGPLAALEWLVAELGRHGLALEPGDVVLAGGLTAAVPLAVGGVVEARFGDDTTVRVRR